MTWNQLFKISFLLAASMCAELIYGITPMASTKQTRMPSYQPQLVGSDCFGGNLMQRLEISRIQARIYSQLALLCQGQIRRRLPEQHPSAIHLLPRRALIFPRIGKCQVKCANGKFGTVIMVRRQRFQKMGNLFRCNVPGGLHRFPFNQ